MRKPQNEFYGVLLITLLDIIHLGYGEAYAPSWGFKEILEYEWNDHANVFVYYLNIVWIFESA